MKIYSVVFALSRQINKQKVCENNLLWGLTPTPPCVRPWTLVACQCSPHMHYNAELAHHPAIRMV